MACAHLPPTFIDKLARFQNREFHLRLDHLATQLVDDEDAFSHAPPINRIALFTHGVRTERNDRIGTVKQRLASAAMQGGGLPGDDLSRSADG